MLVLQVKSETMIENTQEFESRIKLQVWILICEQQFHTTEAIKHYAAMRLSQSDDKPEI